MPTGVYKHKSSQGFQKGYSWIRGLTKETDIRLAEYGKKISKTKMGHSVSDETKKKISESTKISMLRIRDRLSQMASKRIRTPEENLKRSISCKELWKDPNHAKKVMHRRPMSKPEIKMEGMLKSLNLPYTFTGNVEKRTVVINGKVPDFTHISKPKIIEVWGDFFHKHQNPLNRINFFKENGYDCIVIWASEIESEPEKVMDKIVEFTGE